MGGHLNIKCITIINNMELSLVLIIILSSAPRLKLGCSSVII